VFLANSLGERWGIYLNASACFRPWISTLEEGPMNGARMLGTWLKGLRESLLVESVYGVACGLWIAAQIVSDLVGVHALRSTYDDHRSS
jgi:hypothetical protein